MQVDTRGLSRDEVIDLYYGIYLFRLRARMITVGQAKIFIRELELTEEYEGCAGLKKAIDAYISENVSDEEE